jgi:hypothetical protein
MRSSIPNATERVRDSIRALRATLLAPSPEALESHLPALEAALHELQCDPQGLQHDSRSRRDLEALARELRVVGSLIEHGIAFQQGWAKLLAAATGGYRPDGEPRPLQTPGRISMQG